MFFYLGDLPGAIPDILDKIAPGGILIYNETDPVLKKKLVGGSNFSSLRKSAMGYPLSYPGRHDYLLSWRSVSRPAGIR